MKRILIVVAILLVLFLAVVYLFIPNRVKFSQQTTIHMNSKGLLRNLGNKQEWAKWWPEKNQPAGGPYTLNGRSYEPLDAKILSVPFRIGVDGGHVIADIGVVADGLENTTVFIEGSLPTSYNPFKRIQRYFTARGIRKDATTLLNQLNDHYATVLSVYGYNIRSEKVVDSTLLINMKEVTGYPGNGVVYALVDELKNYIKAQGAEETGFPMLNIFTKDSLQYLVKVAIPVNKKLPDSGTMSYRWMLGGGNILITEVKGGPAALRKAYLQIEQFISDFQRVAPAIPFESLVTDRRQQPDSSQWITRIYYPVM
jgi:hypothetical protein